MEVKVVFDLINYLKNHVGELVVTRVKKHPFLGMDINITEDKKFEIQMKEKLWEEIGAFGEDLDENLTTPGAVGNHGSGRVFLQSWFMRVCRV